MRKLKSIAFIPVLIVFIASCSNTKDIPCSKFKTGKFLMEVQDLEIEIFRDEFKQVESFGSTKSNYSITWKDDCHYRLELIGKSNLDVAQNIKIFDVEITGISNDTCFFSTTSPGIDFVDKSWMKKL